MSAWVFWLFSLLHFVRKILFDKWLSHMDARNDFSIQTFRYSSSKKVSFKNIEISKKFAHYIFRNLMTGVISFFWCPVGRVNLTLVDTYDKKIHLLFVGMAGNKKPSGSNVIIRKDILKFTSWLLITFTIFFHFLISWLMYSDFLKQTIKDLSL